MILSPNKKLLGRIELSTIPNITNLEFTGKDGKLCILLEDVLTMKLKVM